MSLWVDKHRPSSLNKLDYHKDQATLLKKLVSILLTKLWNLHYLEFPQFSLFFSEYSIKAYKETLKINLSLSIKFVIAAKPELYYILFYKGRKEYKEIRTQKAIMLTL